MSSNLKVNTILPSTGSNIGIGTNGGELNVDGGCKVQVGTALTLGHSIGLQYATQNLHSEGFEINQINASGIITASSFSGSGANLTSLPAQATISNNSDNRVITGGSGVNLNGESGLTFDGTTLTVSGASNSTQAIFAGTGGSGSRGLEIKTESGGAVDEVVIIKTRASGTTGAIKFQTNGANSLELTGNGGDVIVKQGNLKFGIGGKGIDFSSTGDASGMTGELLDDYEEGSFTPQFDGLSNTPAYAIRNGRYTKIGRYVHITGIMQAGGTNPTFSNTSNILKITGLPFAGFGVMYYVSLGNVSHQNWNFLSSGNNENNFTSGNVDGVNCQMEHNTSNMIFMVVKSGQTRARVRNASVHNQGFIIMFELSYTTA